MATATTSYTSSTCPRVQLVTSISSDGATSATVSWTLKYVTNGYTLSTSATKTVTAKIGSTTVYNSAITVGGKTSYTIKTGTTTISKTTASQTISISVSIAWGSATWSGTTLGTRSGSSSFTVSAKTSYTITYNANGGSGAPSSQTKWYGTTLTLSSTKPTRTGYTFKSWNTASGGSGTSYSAGGSYTANAAATLYAQWTANTYTISYDANGGSGAPSSQTKTYGVTLTLSSTKPTRTGYTFSKWNTNSSGTGTSYAAGASFTTNAATTLYAIWTVNSYTYTFNANGGSSTTTKTVTYGSTFSFSSVTTPTRTNYTFLGWSTSSSATSATYTTSSSVTVGTSSVTYYAIWELAHTAPSVAINSLYRCTSSTDSTVGSSNYAYISITWSINDSYTVSSIAITAAGTTTLTASGSSGTSTAIVAVNTNATTVSVKVTDSASSSTTVSKTLAASYIMPIAVYPDGKAVGFGMLPTASSRVESAYPLYVENNTVIRGTTYSTLPHDYEVHTTDAGLGTAGYIHFATITITTMYANQPIEMKVLHRGGNYVDKITICFANKSSTDPALSTFAIISGQYNTDSTYYMYKNSTSVWYLYTIKTEAYDDVTVLECNTGAYNRAHMTITWTSELVTSLPSGYTSAAMVLAYNGSYVVCQSGLYTGSAVEGTSGTYITDHIEIYNSSTPYIDFHYANSTSDYTGRIINGSNYMQIKEGTGVGYLTVYNTSWNTSDTSVAGHIQLANGVPLCGYNTSGTAQCLIELSTSNNIVVGNMYNTSGATVNIYTNAGSINFCTAGSTTPMAAITSVGKLRIGPATVSDGTNTRTVYAYWADGVAHELIGIAAAGLISYFGWAGSSSYATKTYIRGQACYYTNSSGTTTLSDRNLKEDFISLDDNAYDIFFDNLNPTAFKYILGQSGRHHFGYITQEVESALETAGLTTKDFAGVNIKQITDREVEEDEEGIKHDVYASSDNYLLDKGITEEHDLVYTEFIALNTSQIQKLKSRVTELESQIEELTQLLEGETNEN